MAQETTARLVSATVTFEKENGSGYDAPIALAHQQKVTLNRSSEKKELLSNDRSLGESVDEVETKVTYELSTEIGDTSLTNLALAFKGVVSTVEYKVDDTYWNGKKIKASTVAGAIGDVVLEGSRIYIVKEAYPASATFNATKYSDRTYAVTQKQLSPQKNTSTKGRIIVDGENVSTGAAQVLIIPKVNLSFDGDLAVSDTDYIKLAFKGKVLKKEGEDLFKLIDA